MSVIYDVHQVPIGIPHVWPTTHAELVEQPWLIYSLTAVWRLDLSKKHPFVGNVVGVLVGVAVELSLRVAVGAAVVGVAMGLSFGLAVGLAVREAVGVTVGL
jgi:hypothetical protein